MSTLGNVIWLIFGGLLAALGYILGGLALCLTVIGIPFGVQSMKIGLATLSPFCKELVEVQKANSPLRVSFNVIWILFFGWEIALAHLVSGLILTVTVVGIPFGKQHFKLLPLALFPFGRNLQ